MAIMFARHQVADCTAWRKIYDGLAPTQAALGVTAKAVYQAAGDPNDVTVTHEFATIEAAQSFAGSTEVKTAMHDAGVVGAPMIWFASRS